MQPTIIKIDEVEYVRKDSLQSPLAVDTNGLPYMMVRTYSAGVFAGYLRKREGMEVELIQARRIWYWDGAASLSQLATEGTKKPQNCKFPCPVGSIVLTQAIELIPITEKAKKSIEGVPVWTQ